MAYNRIYPIPIKKTYKKVLESAGGFTFLISCLESAGQGKGAFGWTLDMPSVEGCREEWMLLKRSASVSCRSP